MAWSGDVLALPQSRALPKGASQGRVQQPGCTMVRRNGRTLLCVPMGRLSQAGTGGLRDHPQKPPKPPALWVLVKAAGSYPQCAKLVAITCQKVGPKAFPLLFLLVSRVKKGCVCV